MLSSHCHNRANLMRQKIREFWIQNLRGNSHTFAQQDREANRPFGVGTAVYRQRAGAGIPTLNILLTLRLRPMARKQREVLWSTICEDITDTSRARRPPIVESTLYVVVPGMKLQPIQSGTPEREKVCGMFLTLQGLIGVKFDFLYDPT